MDDDVASAILFKNGVQVATKVVESSETSVSFEVAEGGFYTVALNDKDGKLLVTSSVTTVVDKAANDSWSGHKLSLSQKPDSDNQYWFKETGKAVDFTISDVLDINGKGIGSSNFVVKYYEKADISDPTDAEEWASATALSGAPKDADEYYVAAWPVDSYLAGVTVPVYQDFTIAAADAAELSLYEINEDGTTNDTTFVYSGGNFLELDGQTLKNLGLLADGEAVELKVPKGYTDLTGIDNGDYFLFKADGSEVKTTTNSAIVNAGKHTLEIKQKVSGASNTTGCPTVAYLELNVDKFDLSKATVTLSDTTKNNAPTATFEYEGASFKATFGASGDLTQGSADITLADGTAINDAADTKLLLTVKSYEKPAKLDGVFPLSYFENVGTYTVSIDEESEGAFANVSGSNFAFSGDALTAECRVVANLIDDFSYGADATSGNGNFGTKVTINKEDGDVFDLKKITWWNPATGKTVEYNGSNAEITITKDGEEVSSVDAVGTYKVTVATLPDGLFQAAGTATLEVQVVNSDASADVYMTFEGKPVVSNADLTVNETGEAFEYGVVVKGQNEAGTILEEGVDYTVTVTKDGKEVDEIKEIGDYTVTVKSTGGWQFTPASFDVSVIAAEYDGIEIIEPTYGYDTNEYKVVMVKDPNNSGAYVPAVAQETGYAYTGEAVTPVVKAYVEKTDAKGETVRSYTELDPSLYTITYKDSKGYAVKAEDLKKVDTYKATVVIDQEAFETAFGEGAGFGSGADFSFGDTSASVDEVADLTFDIVNTIKGGFSDVKASEWYADEATKAKQLGYMTGLSGTNMLLPTANITRADVAMVLMRMAGGDPTLGANETYPTKFSDVEADAYYAKAVDWAYKAGIISGYDGTDSFGPNDLVTREQLAKMIALFAQNVQGEDISGGSLEGYVDAGELTFGKEYMAYCVEAGVFGVNTDALDPSGNAQRAQVAAISVRLCPAQEL